MKTALFLLISVYTIFSFSSCKTKEPGYFELTGVHGTNMPCPTAENKKKFHKEIQKQNKKILKEQTQERQRGEQRSQVNIKPIPQNVYGKSFLAYNEPQESQFIDKLSNTKTQLPSADSPEVSENSFEKNQPSFFTLTTKTTTFLPNVLNYLLSIFLPLLAMLLGSKIDY